MDKLSEKCKRQIEKTAHDEKCIKNGLRAKSEEEPMRNLKNGYDGCDSVVDQNNFECPTATIDLNLDLENREVFSGKTTSNSKKNKKLKTRRKKGGVLQPQQNQQQQQPLSSSYDIDDEHDDDLSPQDVDFVSGSSSKESSSLDSGIESDHLTCTKFDFNNIDKAFIDFLGRHDNNDEFLDASIKYVCPKFTCNRVDNVMAFTLHAKNVQPDSIKAEKLTDINAARVKFTSYNQTSKVQIHYAFFVKLMVQQLHGNNNTKTKPGVYNNNNETTAMIIQEVSAESWDNNVVFQIDLDPRKEIDLIAEYKAGPDQFHLEPYPLESKLESMVVPEEHESDEGLSIEVNSSENEIKIAIKTKEVAIPSNCESAHNKRRNKKKNRLRSASESYCDELKVISESESINGGSGSDGNKPNDHLKGIREVKEPVRKTRSVSESYHEIPKRNGGAAENQHLAPKYKGILKNSYDHHSISIDSSVDDLFYSVSLDRFGSIGGGYGSTTTDHELSESCKKSVRFSDHITRQLYK